MTKFLLTLLLNTPLFVCAQYSRPQGQELPDIFIKGKLIQDGTNTPIEFATVSVFSERDSLLVTGGLTDVKGLFDIPVKPGKYFLKTQFMGFESKLISDITLDGKNRVYDVGEVAIKESEQFLDELVVQAERTEMELTLDKKVYNIGKDLSNLGGSASDLLANLPSVEVDVEGNVSLRGSQNVQILVDGKPSGLIGLSGTGGLQQLQENLIEPH